MKSWGSWNKWVAAGVVASGVSVAAFNIGLDPYSVLGTANWLRQGYQVNERFGKIEHLRQNVGRYDSFILGASTMGLFPTEQAELLRPESRWYNLSFLAGTPPEALRALKFLKASGNPIKEVVYGIDVFAFRKLEKHRQLWRREHPLVTGESWGSWWEAHVFASTFLDGIERITHSLKDKPRVVYDIQGSGRYYLPRWDAEIAADHEAYIKRNIYERVKARDGGTRASGIVLVKERFDELRELKEWLEREGIRATFWINPMHWKNLDTIDAASMMAFRNGVKEAVGEVADYTLRNDVCGDDKAFYEWQHFTPATAARILAEVMPGSNLVEAATARSQRASTDLQNQSNATPWRATAPASAGPTPASGG